MWSKAISPGLCIKADFINGMEERRITGMEDCCSTGSPKDVPIMAGSQPHQPANRVEALCPQCGQKGKSVPGQTVKAMLSDSLRLVEATMYYFCRTESCPVVYFSANLKSTFTTNQLRERVYQKEPGAADVNVCYCFDHRVGEVLTGSPAERSLIIEDIQAGITAGQCACDLRNPQGTCCLGNVQKIAHLAEV